MMKERVLVFAAHPDDDAIGAGGSIVKHLRAGREVSVVYAGDTSGIDCSFLPPEEYARRQREETYASGAVLGLKAKNLILLDEHPWRYNEERLRFAFLEVVRRVKPAICYLPHEKDGHIDHRVVSAAARDAINMAPSPWFRKFGDNDPVPAVETVLAFEVWTPLEAPNYFEKLTKDVLDIKMACLRERRTQEVGKYEHAYRGMNAYRGAMHEGEVAEYAEAFRILKATRLF